MIYVLGFFAFLVGALIGPRYVPGMSTPTRRLALRIGFGLLAFMCLLATSIIEVPADEVGILRKIYGAKTLPPGHVIAARGETGHQARIVPPGAFEFSPFVRVINAIVYVPVVNVPQGFYGRIVTRDGQALEQNQVMADAWPDAEFSKFLDAEYFMTNGGKKGLQAAVLRPGAYPLNLALYTVRIGYVANGRDVQDTTDEVYDIGGKHIEKTPLTTQLTTVPAGFVGVVRSTISEPGRDCTPIQANTDQSGLEAQLVPQGCKGIWESSLPPGDYYLNRDAYEVILVDTRVQSLEFKGGYLKRFIDLKVAQNGDFVQSERTETAPFDRERSVDTAVYTKVEGWEAPQELRAVLQVRPEKAPVVVAAVGKLDAIEQRIIIPAIRSHVRNVFGGLITVSEKDASGNARTVTRPTRVFDLIEQRPVLEDEILTRTALDGRRAGVDVKEIRLGDSIIPPELLLARQREQLAQQLKRAYEQEQVAQTQRQAAEQARATADQQKDLVTAQIAVQAARLNEDKRRADGRAERGFLEELAAGQTAQANVLGKDSVLALQQFKMVVDLLASHPDVLSSLRLPNTMVFGSGLEGAAALVGQSLGVAQPSRPASAAPPTR